MQKRRWGSWWSLYWCFGSHKQNKRIGHAALVPEPTASRADAPATENSTHAFSVALPFVAPPSSPASFFQSEPPSVTHSPVGLLSITSVSASMYSPGERPSIFAIGPYAHETQLVSPPVFSTLTTEPSTAPFTPPPESAHLTTPSSPEVPFAQLLDPNFRNGEAGQRFPLSHYEFQSYQLYPGSPVGHLISPRSVISGSGTSSPFPDRDFPVGGHHFLEFQAGEPLKLFNLDKRSIHEWGSWRGSGSLTPDAVKLPAYELGSRQGSGVVTPDSVGHAPPGGFLLDCQTPEVVRYANSENCCRINEMVVDPRVSFELTAGDVVSCVEKEPTALCRAVPGTSERKETPGESGKSGELGDEYHCRLGQTVGEIGEKAPSAADGKVRQQQHHQKHRSITLGSIKEFDFDHADGRSDKANISSDWWTNEQVVAKEGGPSKNWSFFPMLQPGVS